MGRLNENEYIGIELPGSLNKEMLFIHRPAEYNYTKVTLASNSAMSISSVDNKLIIVIPTEPENISRFIDKINKWLDLNFKYKSSYIEGLIAVIDKRNYKMIDSYEGWPTSIEVQPIIPEIIPGDLGVSTRLVNITFIARPVSFWPHFKHILPEDLTYDFCLKTICEHPHLIKCVPDRFKDQEMILASKL